MPVPWLRLIDGVLGATDVLRYVRGRSGPPAAPADAAPAQNLETKLTGVVVAALKEAFDRDHQRLDLERQRLEEERIRAERAMRFELLRQAGEREIGRLRMVAGVAVGSLLASMFLVTRIVGGEPAARVALGVGWLLLIAATGAAFSAQSQVGRAVAELNDRSTAADAAHTAAGSLAPWLVVLGLASIGFGVLAV